MAQLTYKQALNKTMAICSRSEKCVSDIRKKLSEWKVDPENAKKIITLLQQEKFIDEQRYAGYFVNDKFRFNKWGKVKISFMLKAKGISQFIIEDALGQIDDQSYFETLVQLFLQKLKVIRAPSDCELKAKLTRFAQGRGFEYEVIEKALSEIQTENESL